MEGWVCPNDRQLLLRARLGTGWSTFSAANQRRANSKLSHEELDHICRVLQRNEAVNDMENQRVEFMIKRLENLTLSTSPHGKTSCNLCGQEFGLLSKSCITCLECGRLVCPRCSMEFTDEIGTGLRDQDIAPSRYLPPNAAAAAVASTSALVPATPTSGFALTSPLRVGSRAASSTTSNKSDVLRRFWRSRQMSENNESIPFAQSTSEKHSNGQFAGLRRQMSHKASSSDRSSTALRLSQLLPLPNAAVGSSRGKVAIGGPGGGCKSTRQKRYHLCKLCCEAREVWKRSGAWFHKSLPKTKRYSCPSSPLNTSAPDTSGNTAIQGPSDLVPCTSNGKSRNDEWTRIEPRKRTNECAPLTAATADSNNKQDQKTFDNPSCCDDPQSAPSTAESPNRREDANALHSSPWRNSQGPQSACPKSVAPTLPRAMMNTPPQDTKVSVLFPDTSTRVPVPILPPIPLDFKLNTNILPQKKPGMSVAEAPLGILYFSIKHDVSKAELDIDIHNAKNLIAMDANGLSDPFVVCQLLPAAGKRFRTRTIPQNLNPVWNEFFTFNDFDNRNLEKRVLRFAVLDEDIFGADWLGEYRLNLGELLPDRLSEFAVPLNPRKPLPKEIDDLANPTRGKIQLALRYVEETKQLRVEVLRCAHLAPMDHNGSSDPFVKLYLRPDKLRKTKQKTKVKKSTLFPEFNEQFVYLMDAADVNKRTLEITVWDFDRGATNDFIGGLTLGAKAKAERREVWQAVFRPPYRRFEAWFQLASRSDNEADCHEMTSLTTPGVCD